jgi:DNA-binding response OmpR family regulator
MAQTILVIDDSADLRTMVKNYLAAPGRVYSRLELLNQV